MESTLHFLSHHGRQRVLGYGHLIDQQGQAVLPESPDHNTNQSDQQRQRKGAGAVFKYMGPGGIYPVQSVDSVKINYDTHYNAHRKILIGQADI